MRSFRQRMKCAMSMTWTLPFARRRKRPVQRTVEGQAAAQLSQNLGRQVSQPEKVAENLAIAAAPQTTARRRMEQFLQRRIESRKARIDGGEQTELRRLPQDMSGMGLLEDQIELMAQPFAA